MHSFAPMLAALLEMGGRDGRGRGRCALGIACSGIDRSIDVRVLGQGASEVCHNQCTGVYMWQASCVGKVLCDEGVRRYVFGYMLWHAA